MTDPELADKTYVEPLTVPYLDGGICWSPNPNVYFNVLFPNPKIGRRLTT